MIPIGCLSPFGGDVNLSWFRGLLLKAIHEGGARVSHRGDHFFFNERDATLLLDTITDQQSGLSVGDEVHIRGFLLSPWQLAQHDAEANRDDFVLTGTEKKYQILVFFKVTGRTKGKKNPAFIYEATPPSVCFEGTFCALIQHDSNAMQLCKGQELSEITQTRRHSKEKVTLYWTGCLEKAV